VAALPKAPSNFGVLHEAENRFRTILVETFPTAKRIVLESAAVGAALRSQIERELKEGSCAVLPVEALWLRLNYGFILKRSRTTSPAVSAFMEIVRELEADGPQ
jgi:DNA-binding transcriptional LysR family regulator